jgi:hypothetical protein
LPLIIRGYWVIRGKRLPGRRLALLSREGLLL